LIATYYGKNKKNVSKRKEERIFFLKNRIMERVERAERSNNLFSFFDFGNVNGAGSSRKEILADYSFSIFFVFCFFFFSNKRRLGSSNKRRIQVDTLGQSF